MIFRSCFIIYREQNHRPDQVGLAARPNNKRMNLNTNIYIKHSTYMYIHRDIQSSIKKDIHKQDRLIVLSEANAQKLRLDENTRRAVDLASESGASSWLTSLPLTEFGFTLHKGVFWDALALRYGWLTYHIPTHCECGAKFTIDHCRSCQKG